MPRPSVSVQRRRSISIRLTITLSGIDKQKLGQVAAELNRLRKPDAYKGKGVRYADKYLQVETW